MRPFMTDDAIAERLREVELGLRTLADQLAELVHLLEDSEEPA